MFHEQKRGLRAAMAGLFLLVSCITGCLVLTRSAAGQEPTASMTLPAGEVCFTLNGVDFPRNPILQDFLDRGWKIEKECGTVGCYDEETGPYHVVASGYYLTKGKNRVAAYLNEDDCQNGLEPGMCRLKSMSTYGVKSYCHADSLCVDGIELTAASNEEMRAYLGNPNAGSVQYGTTEYHVSLPEQGIFDLEVDILPDGGVGQMFFIFEHPL